MRFQRVWPHEDFPRSKRRDRPVGIAPTRGEAVEIAVPSSPGASLDSAELVRPAAWAVCYLPCETDHFPVCEIDAV
jgi:hypothetical protein